MGNTASSGVDKFAQELDLVSDIVRTDEPKQIGPSNALGPFFNTLPQEIRDMIFADCLESGYPQFMACSRAMREEGLPWIWEKGVYRMNFAKVDSSTGSVKVPPESPIPTQDIVDRIQNISIRVESTPREPDPYWLSLNLDPVKLFAGPEIRRKYCLIVFEARDDARDVYVGRNFLDVLKTLRGFETVEVRSVPWLPSDAWVPRPWKLSPQVSQICRPVDISWGPIYAVRTGNGTWEFRDGDMWDLKEVFTRKGDSRHFGPWMW